MRIKAIRIEDFKRISNVEITDADRAIVVLGGNNASGKSSALDAITAALAGGKAIPSEPIRRGADRAEIEIDLGEVIVKRTITRREDGSHGGTLTIRTADGMSPRGAQGWLDARLGNLALDPVAFMALKPEAQAARLRDVAGVDTSAIDARRRALFDDRAEIGRDGKRVAGSAAMLPHYPDAPTEEVIPAVAPMPVPVVPALVSVSEIARELEAARAAEAAHTEAVRLRDHVASQAAEAEAEIARLEQLLVAACEAHTRLAGEASDRAGEVVRLLGAVVPTEPIRQRLAAADADNARIRAEVDAANATARAEADAANAAARANADAVNTQVRANAARAAREAEAGDLRRQYAAKTAAIDACDAERVAMLAAASFPVPGLGFGADGLVTLHGLPLEQASGAEKIRVSMALALAGSPEIRVVLIRDASLLDADSMAVVAAEAEAAGAQVWLERVGAADEGAVVIVDGGAL